MRAGADLPALIDGFAARTVLVVGDLILDEYLIGRPTRVSREAPVVVLGFAGREARLGGAANAAHNVVALGARALPVGVVGDDAGAAELRQLFGRAGITTAGLVEEAGRVTPTKTRVMAGVYPATRQQVARIDREPAGEPGPASERALRERLRALGDRADAILISDYGYGTVSPGLFAEVRALAARTGALVTADSRHDLTRFAGVSAATPNEAELAELAGEPVDDERAVDKAGRQLLERLEAGLLLVTRGSRGLALLEREGATTFIPVSGSDQIADVVGAGDTVIGTFTVALAAGAAPLAAATLANLAGGLVVMKRGTATVSADELRRAAAAAGPAGR